MIEKCCHCNEEIKGIKKVKVWNGKLLPMCYSCWSKWIRLTEKISNEILVKNKNGNGSRSICYGCDGISNCTTRVCNFYRAMEKLAAYEDTGLEPKEIRGFANLELEKERKNNG